MKGIREIMSKDVAVAMPDSKLLDTAKMMVEFDCGQIPIVANMSDKKIVGVITDRDIVCRTLGIGLNPMDMTVKDCMSADVVTADINMNVQDCMELMRDNQIRRVPVVDENQKVCGMISQADLIQYVNEADAVDMIQEVSRPTDSPSAVQ